MVLHTFCPDDCFYRDHDICLRASRGVEEMKEDKKYKWDNVNHNIFMGRSGWTGWVSSPWGLVVVYSMEGFETVLTRLRFIHKNEMYERTFDRTFTKRGLITKARTFAEEITNERS